MELRALKSYWLVRPLFQCALAVIYLVAFLVAANQFRQLTAEENLFHLQALEVHCVRIILSSPRRPSDRVIGIAA